MSTTISKSEVYQFIKQSIGSDEKLDEKEAKDLGIKADFVKSLGETDDQCMDIDDIMKNDRLYEDFASMAKAEKEAEQAKKDKDKEDEDNDKRRTGNSGNSGGA